MDTKTKFMIGLLSGAFVGAAAGLLVAPNSGKETRTALMHQMGRFRARVIKGRAGRRLVPAEARRSAETDHLH